MIDIADIPALLKRRLLLLVLCPAILVALSVVYLAFKTPVFSANSEILIEANSQQLVTIEPSNGGSGPLIQSVDIDSQAFILTSAAVLNDVANTLDLDNDPGLHRLGLRQKLMGVSPRQMSATEKRAQTLYALRQNLSILRLDRSFVFRITATHPDPEKAAQIANEVGNAYIRQLRDDQNTNLIRSSDALGQQASELRKRLETAENAVETYKADNGLISTEQGGLVVDQQIQALNTQITQARVTLENARATYLLVDPLTTADVEAGAVPSSVNDTVLSSLRLQYSRIAQQEAEAATTLGANHPTLRELRSQLENTRQQIAGELQRTKRRIKSEYEQAERAVAALERQLGTLQSANSEQGKALIELRQLQSEVDASRAVYEAFLKRSRELGEQPNLESNGTRILSEAQPSSSPTGPSKGIVILAAAVFGFAIAAGGIVGVAILTGQITSQNDLVRRTGLPVLTSLPGKRRDSLSLLPRFGKEAGSISTARELALTRLAYAIRQSFEGEKPANILVLSADHVEDTQAVCRELALVLHQMGEDVLLATTSTGREQQVAGQTAQISPSDKTANKGVLERIGHLTAIAGAAKPSQQEPLMASGGGLSQYLHVERMDTRRKYASRGSLDGAVDDFLIIDGGSTSDNPILPVLLRYCDGIILVTSLGEATVSELDEALSYLKPWQDRVLGNVVLEAA